MLNKLLVRQIVNSGIKQGIKEHLLDKLELVRDIDKINRFTLYINKYMLFRDLTSQEIKQLYKEYKIIKKYKKTIEYKVLNTILKTVAIIY